MSLEAIGSFEDEDLYGYGTAIPSEGKMGRYAVGKMEGENLSHHVTTAYSLREGAWNLRKAEVLQSNHKFGKNILLAGRETLCLVVCGELNSDGSAGGTDNNRDNDNRTDRNSDNKGELTQIEKYLIDKVVKIGNGHAGDVIGEVYVEIVRPTAIEICQAVGDQVINHETPP